MAARDDVNSSTSDARMEGDNGNQRKEKDIENCHKWPSIHLLSRENRNVYLSVCVPLHKAALKGDWPTAKHLLGNNPRSILCTSITEGHETLLHVAAGAGQALFVEELVKLMEPEDLMLQDRNGNTAFCFAAAAGAMHIARIMLEKNASLLKIRGGKNMTPLYMAAVLAKRDMASFLYGKAKDNLTSEDRNALFFTCLNTDLYDLALKLLEDHSDLAVARDGNFKTALHVLARKPSAFVSRNLGLLTRLINSVPGILKFTHNSETTHAVHLVKCLWKEILNRRDIDVTDLIRKPSQLLFDAAELGNFEFLAELICTFPDLVHEIDDNNRSIFHVAVLHRHANIFNIIYEIGFTKELIATFIDNLDNNILHLAAKYRHPSRVGTLSGAALQVQRELLWFKEVEKIVQPSFREMRNSDGKTPQELFTMEHASLLNEGEQWMKNTAHSCMLVATLIATIVFEAAFSVPGGNDNSKGIPIHLGGYLFQVFAMADIIALSSSSMSILMFLSILTSRYAENDFHKSLPFKLMLGLSALFISIIAMMVAFSTTFFLAYHDRWNWVTVLTTVLAAAPVSLFVMLQYPLLKDIFYSTYHSRYLFKPSKPMLS